MDGNRDRLIEITEFQEHSHESYGPFRAIDLERCSSIVETHALDQSSDPKEVITMEMSDEDPFDLHIAQT